MNKTYLACLLCGFSLCSPFSTTAAVAKQAPTEGVASWYGEQHRGKLMANGKPFNPDKLTAASWFYPLGTKVKVSGTGNASGRSVVVTITDRGPAWRLVNEGRIIDLGHAAFQRLASPQKGLIPVRVQILGQ